MAMDVGRRIREALIPAGNREVVDGNAVVDALVDAHRDGAGLTKGEYDRALDAWNEVKANPKSTFVAAGFVDGVDRYFAVAATDVVGLLYGAHMNFEAARGIVADAVIDRADEDYGSIEEARENRPTNFG